MFDYAMRDMFCWQVRIRLGNKNLKRTVAIHSSEVRKVKISSIVILRGKAHYGYSR